MARLVVSAAVGVIAYAATGFTAPQVGFAAASLTYGATGFLDPTKHLYGSKLVDLKAPTASYGSPWPYVEGAPRLAGVVLYASDKRAVANTTSQGGKGGPGVESTTYSYEIDLLIGLGINKCAAVRRAFANGKLFWSNADDADGETLAASEATVYWRDMRFYNGDATQMPDPVYEAAVGMGNAPAYRGRTTLFIEGLNLGQSGQLPVLTFEVPSEATGALEVVTYEAAAPSPAPFTVGTPAYKLNTPFNAIVAGSDTFSGTIISLDVYSVDAAAQTSLLTNHFAIGAHAWSALVGNSDESCIVLPEDGSSPVDYVDYFDANGASVRLDTSMNGFSGKVFSKVDDDIVLAVFDVSSGDRKLRRYRRSDGALMATASVALVTDVQSVAIGGGYIYSLAEAGDNLYKSDLTTLALVDTIAIPSIYNAGSGSGHVACDGATPYVLIAGSNAWTIPLIKWTGATWEPIAYASNSSGTPHDPDPTPSLVDLYAEPVDTDRFGFGDGIPFSQKFDTDHIDFHYLLGKTAILLPTLDQVVRRLCLRAGLTDADIDVTDLEGIPVRGFAITQIGSARQTLETLMIGYLFECVEAEKLVFVLRGALPKLTIPYADLGAGKDTGGEPLPIKRLNDNEIPALISVKYANTLADFQDGIESGDRLVTESKSVSVTELALGFTPTEAKRLADALTMDQAVATLAIGPASVTRKYAKLQPTDVVLLTDAEGNLFRARITRCTYSEGIYTYELALDDATAINSAAATDSGYTSSTLIRVPAPTILELIDGPLFRDVDDSYGMYAAVKPASDGRWPGMEALKSLDDVSYASAFQSSTRAVFGTATTTLGDFTGGNVFDTANTLTVDVGTTLSSVSRDALLTTEANALMVGSEVIQFSDAAFVSAGVYTLSGLRRGLRGTEWAMPDHVAAERVVLLDATKLRNVSEDGSARNVPYYWKGVSLGQSRGAVAAQTFTNTDVRLKPFAPVDLRFNLDAGEVTWHRRSRLSSRFLATTVVPLGEASESYDVELRDGSDVLVDSATVSEPVYSASGLAQGDAIPPAIWGMHTISGDIIAVENEIPFTNSSSAKLVKLDGSGAVAQASPVLGEEVYQWTNNGDSIYAVCAHINLLTTPQYFIDTRVVKLTRATLTTIDATNTSSSPGDYAGVAHDGTNAWVSERISGNLRKLNATTLVSAASYAIAGTPTALRYSGGKLWVLCEDSSELVKWDIATQTEDARISLGGRPADLILASGNVFVATSATLEVYDEATGSLVVSHSYAPNLGGAQRLLALFGSQVVEGVNPPQRLLFLDAATGDLDNAVSSPYGNLFYVAGSSGSDLYITGREGSGFSLETRKFTVATIGLAGYTFTVWQNSATVGRGYPASLEL